MIFFFLFKQKTAYEMRISDWSSDVCSSDLAAARKGAQQVQRRRRLVIRLDHPLRVGRAPGRFETDVVDDVAAIAGQRDAAHIFQIGRARLGELARDRKSTRLNSSHQCASRMPSSA